MYKQASFKQPISTECIPMVFVYQCVLPAQADFVIYVIVPQNIAPSGSCSLGMYQMWAIIIPMLSYKFYIIDIFIYQN